MAFGKLGAMGRGFGTLGALGKAGTSTPAGPAAPAITWSGVTTDTTPDFSVDLPSGNGAPLDAAVGDVLRIQYQLQAGGSFTDYLAHTLISGDISGSPISQSGVTPVANGSYYFRARLERTGATSSAWSANSSVTISAVSVPVNSVAPVISGNVQVGQTLSTTNGTWSNSPTGYAYQWQRDGSNIAAATSSTYVLVLADAGTSTTCIVTASNGSGSGSPATSNSLAIDNIPVNSVAPAVTGNTQVGQILTTTNGTWSYTPTSYTYQWKRAGSNIASATTSTYTLVEADAGAAITCAVTAINSAGSGSPATSNSTSIDVYALFLAHIEDPADVFTYSGTVWNSINLGVAASNRRIVVAFAARNSGGGGGTISSASIGGQSLTSQIAGFSDTSNNKAVVLIADVLTGTSGNISVTFSAQQNRCGAGVWAIYGAGSATASATSKVEGAQNSGTVSLAVPAKGVAIGASYHQTAGTATWSGMTKNYDIAIESTISHTGASLNSNAGGILSLSSSWSAADTTGIHVFAAWGP